MGIRASDVSALVTRSLAAHLLLVACVAYGMGWGPVLAPALALVVVRHIRRSGASVWQPAVLWSAGCVLAGQAGIALGWVHTWLLPVNSQVAGAFGLLLTVVFIRAVGQFAEQRERAEARLADREERFRILVQDSTDVLSVLDENGEPSYLSPAIERVTGFPPEHYRHGGYAGHVHPDDMPGLTDALTRVYADPGSEHIALARIQHADGDWRWMESTLRDFRDKPAVGGVVATFRDVTERLRAQERLAYDAEHDELTGLINRATFRRELDRLAAKGEPPAVLFVDLDDFKPINDTYGHRYGDEVLVAVAGKLRRSISGADLAARIGGDEFAIALTPPACPDRAAAVAERLLAEMSAPVTVDGEVFVVRASVGIAVPEDGRTAVADLLHRADLAMYAAKRRGTHDAQLYSPAVGEESLQVAHG